VVPRLKARQFRLAQAVALGASHRRWKTYCSGEVSLLAPATNNHHLAACRIC
jgi:hypothetical protein